MDKKQIKLVNDLIAAMSEEEIRSREIEHQRQTENEYSDFERSLALDECSFCDQKISYFTVKRPCLHWLLKPQGFKKKHFPILFERYGFRQINTYLRWVANSDKFAQNINDLVSERKSNKFIEETIKFRNFEWSFSCSNSDRMGHTQAHKGSEPHYHLQMKIDGKVIINFNSFHIPFSEADVFSFAVEDGAFERIKAYRHHDAGMQTILDKLEQTENFDEMLKYTSDVENAAFHTDIILEAKAGTTISGEDLFQLLQEREKSGQSIISLSQRLPNVTVKSMTTSGAGVPEISIREGGRSKKRITEN